jgi:4-aminobutyrate aminotransferase-like enzyme
MIGVRLEGVEAKEVGARALAEGLIVNPIGEDTLRFLPPLIVSEDEIDDALEILRRVLD